MLLVITVPAVTLQTTQAPAKSTNEVNLARPDDDDDALSLTCSDEELWKDIEAELDDWKHTCAEVTKSLAEVTNKFHQETHRRKAVRNVLQNFKARELQRLTSPQCEPRNLETDPWGHTKG